MEKKKLTKLIAIIVLAAAMRIGFSSFNPGNMDVDSDEPWSKINLALRWQGAGTLLPDLNFGPLHTYMISSLIFLSPEHYIALSRVISLVFGLLSIWLYYAVVSRSFGPAAGLLSAFFLAIYPLHVHLSSVSLSEATAYFLLLAALYFLDSYLEKQQGSFLAASCLCLNLCGMLRFECWLFVLLLAAFILRRGCSVRQAGIFLVMASVFPLIWVALNFKYTGNPLGFIETSARVTAVSMQDADYWRRTFGFLKMSAYGLNPVIFFLGVIGVLQAIAGRITRGIFLFLLISAFFVFELRSLSGSYAYYVLRYSLVLGLLLIPFAAAGLLHLGKKRSFLPGWLASSIVAGTLIFSAATLGDFSRKLLIPPSLHELVGWIKTHVSANERVLLECGVNHPFITVNSRLSIPGEQNYDHLGMLAIRRPLTFNGKVRRFTFLLLLLSVFLIFGIKRRLPAKVYYILMPLFVSGLFALSLGLGREAPGDSEVAPARESLVKCINDSDYIVMNKKKGNFRSWLVDSGQDLGVTAFENDDWKVYAKKG